MNNSLPTANSDAPVAPRTAAPAQESAAPITPAAPTSGATHQEPAPAPRRSRIPRGPTPASSSSSSSGAPALLELAAANPMFTHQRRAANFFVPDANFMFHVLSICDGMMGSTHRFLQSSPAWLPIVSQLYVSVLWIYHIMRTYAFSGYGLQFASLLHDMTSILRIDECLIPGPLVPFFESLAAVNGPFDWIGDVTPALPEFDDVFNTATFTTQQDYLRSLPIPAVLLDQLAYFSTWIVPPNQTVYGNFEWFRNIFSAPANAQPTARFRIGPHSCGSLHATQNQVNAAREFWNPAFANFARINTAAGQPALVNWSQILGFTNQTGHVQLEWFQHVTIVMQKYCQYFNGSRALKTISPTGLGSVLVRAVPNSAVATRNWLYPRNIPDAFLSSRFAPLHEIPTQLSLNFVHSDHEIEEVAEQYAILTSTNIQWSENNPAQHALAQIHAAATHVGDYWNMMTHRQATGINLKVQYAQLIASRYHQVTALRSE